MKLKSSQEFFQYTTNENLYNGRNIERNGTVGEHLKYYMEIYIIVIQRIILHDKKSRKT